MWSDYNMIDDEFAPLRHFFYVSTQAFLMLASFYAAIVGIIYRKRFKQLKYFFIYPSVSFTETFLTSAIARFCPEFDALVFSNFMIHLFLLVEFVIIYSFYWSILKDSKARILLKGVGVIYATSIISTWCINKTFYFNPEVFFVPQGLILLIPCFYYFFQLIRSPLPNELKTDPNFWVMLGIMAYFGCTLPLFLLDNILDFSNEIERKVYAINCLCYTLFFLLLIKAYLCIAKKA